MGINNNKVQFDKIDESQPKKELSSFMMRAQFISVAISMSWQLAIVVLVSVIGGFEIDQHIHTSPIFVLLGFLIAMLGTYAVIRRVLLQFNSKVNDKEPK